MTQHLYFSLIPEALIASNLGPEEFGTYFAIGSEGKSSGQAAFFEIDPSFRHPFFPIDEGLKRCVPQPDGKPKNSVYISVYRVAEHVALSALGKLYLTTHDGRTLGIERRKEVPEDEAGLHLYHEIIPLHPLVVSSLGPRSFFEFIIKSGDRFVSAPALCWLDLRLDSLATNPENGSADNLPYHNLEHLRNCLVELKGKDLSTKIVDRNQQPSFLYRTIRTGIYFGTSDGLALYPFPSRDELNDKHHHWWRSANT